MHVPKLPTVLAICGIVLGVGSPVVIADMYSVEAYDNATVQTGGPRSGLSGKAYFNIEGADNVGFESYGVARFNVSSAISHFDSLFGVGLWTLDGVQLNLTQDNDFFTENGGVEVFFSEDDNEDIQPGAGIAYPLGSEFDPKSSLLSYSFTEVSDGHVDSFMLSSNALYTDILSDGTGIVTLVLDPTEDAVAATYAGYTHGTYTGPELIIIANPIPAPGAALLALLGLPLIGWVKRRFA